MSRTHPTPLDMAGGEGTTHEFPMLSMRRQRGQTYRLYDPLFASHILQRPDFYEDFFANVTPEGTYDVSAGGTPTVAIDKGKANGQFQITLAATNEAEAVGYDWADYTDIPGNKAPWLQERVLIDVLPGANERMFFGLTSTLAGKLPVLTNVVRYYGFRLEASGVVLLDAQDGTANANLSYNPNAVTLVAATWYTLTMALDGLLNIHFWITQDGQQPQPVGKIPLGGATGITLDATTLQPVALVIKDSGVGVPGVHLDYVRASWDRY